MRFWLILLVAGTAAGAAAAELAPAADSGSPVALVLLVGDQHSAYERTAQLVAAVDRLKAAHPGLPLAFLIDGDTFEYSNVVARRSAGEIEFAMFAALARRAPTVLNLGNHEPEFFDLAETVRRVEATGVKVVGNIVNRMTGQPFAPASLRLRLGREEVVVVGLTTDHLSTYRAAVRPALDLSNPVVWGTRYLPELLAQAPLGIVLSHAGLGADRQLLGLVPAGTLFAGAHDHLRLVHPLGRGVYVHSGSWNEALTLAWLHRDATGAARWVVEQRSLSAADPADPEMAEVIRATRAKFLQSEDTAIIGRTAAALAPAEAARFVAEALRVSAGVDAAFIGNTTFGAGLPAGAVSRLEFDACIRFDGAINIAEVAGARLQQMLAAANQGTDTAFEQRRGEFCFASGPATVDPARRYRVATTDWGARNSRAYFGVPDLDWRELPGPKLKERVLGGLNPP